MTCLIGAGYVMTAEVYNQTSSQDRSGQMVREWDYDNPIIITCNAEPAMSRSSSGATEIWGMEYNAEDWIIVKTTTRLNRRQRIGEIKSGDTYLWLDAPDPDVTGDEGDPMVFEIKGVAPSTDIFGKIVEYVVYAERI